ncbi:MAG: lcfB 2 [Rhizobacter sp.]|nr:lcfB 2 [Rhizobacter sp.]
MSESGSTNLFRSAAGLCVGALFSAQARLTPDRIALQAGNRRWTFAELDSRTNRLARVLAALGVARGDRVAMLSENTPEYVELKLAAAKLGAIVGCLNWRQADPELVYCIGLIAPKVLIASQRFRAVTERIDHGVGIRRVLGDAFESALQAESDHALPDVAQAEDGLLVLYTSGTTGHPKGAVISHRAMVARSWVNAIDRTTDDADAFVAWTPLFHMGASDHVLSTLLRGGKAIVVDGFDAAVLARVMATERLGWLHVMPGTAERLIEELRISRVQPKGLRYIGLMADLMPRAAIARLTRLLNAPYVNTFGSTEAGGVASGGVIGIGVTPLTLSKRQSSLCRVRLVDEEGRDVPDGAPGEMWVRSPALFSGYWGAPELNAEVFAGGWFHTGDVFVRNADASLDFVDRRKYLIKSGGENIYPAEIERLLLASPRIAEAAVVRRPDAQWGEVPVAFVVASDPTLLAHDVIELCREQLAKYKLPREVRFVQASALPRSASGKIIRHELEKQLSTQPPTDGAAHTPD